MYTDNAAVDPTQNKSDERVLIDVSLGMVAKFEDTLLIC